MNARPFSKRQHSLNEVTDGILLMRKDTEVIGISQIFQRQRRRREMVTAGQLVQANQQTLDKNIEKNTVYQEIFASCNFYEFHEL